MRFSIFTTANIAIIFIQKQIFLFLADNEHLLCFEKRFIEKCRNRNQTYIRYMFYSSHPRRYFRSQISPFQIKNSTARLDFIPAPSHKRRQIRHSPGYHEIDLERQRFGPGMNTFHIGKLQRPRDSASILRSAPVRTVAALVA